MLILILMWSKKLTITLLLGFLLLFTHTLISFSDGPPPARTGAPGELTCFNGYCHNNYQLNSGPGTPALESNIPETGYVPGKKYLITPSIKHPDQKRFGFMTMAYNEDLKASVGEIILSEADRTQIKLNDAQDRTYVTHDTAWAAADSAQWTFEWVAPESEQGQVTFYAAFVAADFSENASGDYVYTTHLTVDQDKLNTAKWKLLPSDYLDIIPFDNSIRMHWRLPQSEKATVAVYDLNGQRIYQNSSSIPAATYQQDIHLPRLSSGIYLLSVQVGRWVYSEKISLLK